ADLGGFVGRSGHLIGTSGNLAGRITRGANKLLQAVGHAQKSVAESIALGTRDDFDGQIAFGNGHGDAGHFFQIGDHVVERGGQSADFVVAVNINVLIEVTGIANFASDGDEMRQRLGDGLGGPDSDKPTGDKGNQGSTDSYE